MGIVPCAGKPAVRILRRIRCSLQLVFVAKIITLASVICSVSITSAVGCHTLCFRVILYCTNNTNQCYYTNVDCSISASWLTLPTPNSFLARLLFIMSLPTGASRATQLSWNGQTRLISAVLFSGPFSASHGTAPCATDVLFFFFLNAMLGALSTNKVVDSTSGYIRWSAVILAAGVFRHELTVVTTVENASCTDHSSENLVTYTGNDPRPLRPPVPTSKDSYGLLIHNRNVG